MRVRQLEAFRAVMLCQTVTKASEMLHVSQPAATRLIADLEESVGFALFDRVRGRLIPTAEAHTLYAEVQRSLLGVERIARVAHEIRHQQRGMLRVVAPPVLAHALLPRATAKFLKERPETQVSLLSHTSRTVVDMVVGQRCDIGFAVLAMDTSGTHGEPLLSTRIVCAVPAKHRLANRKSVTPADLKGEAFASFAEVLETRMHVDTIFASHGVERVMNFETQTSHGLCSFVETGMAVALVDAVTASQYQGDGIRFLGFEPVVRMDITVLMPQQHRPAMLAESYVQCVRDFAREHVDPRHIIATN